MNIEVAKMQGILIFDLSDKLRKDEDVVNTAVKSIERNIREALIEEDRRLYWTLRLISYEEWYSSSSFTSRVPILTINISFKSSYRDKHVYKN